ncbi:hypothetical protein BofuT4_P039510.1 [Botrytis cinerea T4]|uniref:Uncharacterized protein n=1 Tax=Botryotinia fuckeliana (strain T4) TaxID=999810 RepID=G2Y309_BOTF4|nr:hypothetical protein BofuT4_P039510.1 [Botrytis cinerea T4]
MQHSRILRRRPNSNQRWISHTGISGTCSNLQILITTDQIASFEKIAPLHGSYLTVSFFLVSSCIYNTSCAVSRSTPTLVCGGVDSHDIGILQGRRFPGSFGSAMEMDGIVVAGLDA